MDYVYCDREDASNYINAYVSQLEQHLSENPQYRANWMSVDYKELLNGEAEHKTVNLFAFKPRAKNDLKVKPIIFVNFAPDNIGTPPPFSKEAQEILDSVGGEPLAQGNDVEKLIDQIAFNAIPVKSEREKSKPKVDLLHYWFTGLYE